ncbi:hypothetical protein AB6A40_003911 [Gnathostoma spinigerum]|uniref:Uncharacterized protein n=1 Tax=Gnathostoma spinigerum TaxID=75299 RepID=A0ABD6ED55_9BILA
MCQPLRGPGAISPKPVIQTNSATPQTHNRVTFSSAAQNNTSHYAPSTPNFSVRKGPPPPPPKRSDSTRLHSDEADLLHSELEMVMARRSQRIQQQ